MSDYANCPHCRGQVLRDESLVNHRITCPRCNRIFVLPPAEPPMIPPVVETPSVAAERVRTRHKGKARAAPEPPQPPPLPVVVADARQPEIVMASVAEPNERRDAQQPAWTKPATIFGGAVLIGVALVGIFLAAGAGERPSAEERDRKDELARRAVWSHLMELAADFREKKYDHLRLEFIRWDRVSRGSHWSDEWSDDHRVVHLTYKVHMNAAYDASVWGVGAADGAYLVDPDGDVHFIPYYDDQKEWDFIPLAAKAYAKAVREYAPGGGRSWGRRPKRWVPPAERQAEREKSRAADLPRSLFQLEAKPEKSRATRPRAAAGVAMPGEAREKPASERRWSFGPPPPGDPKPQQTKPKSKRPAPPLNPPLEATDAD